jgi:molybdopterin synthase catalytic subunit
MLIVVTEAPLDDQAARAHVSRPGNGAVVVFYGCVRNRHEGREVTSVEYHAYGPMAERELAQVARTVAAKHGIADVAVMHRTGSLPVGEPSLVVAVGAPHRAPAFRCAEEIIDVLKQRVPIWKKEIGPGGTTWQEGVTPPQGPA